MHPTKGGRARVLGIQGIHEAFMLCSVRTKTEDALSRIQHTSSPGSSSTRTSANRKPRSRQHSRTRTVTKPHTVGNIDLIQKCMLLAISLSQQQNAQDAHQIHQDTRRRSGQTRECTAYRSTRMERRLGLLSAIWRPMLCGTEPSIVSIDEAVKDGRLLTREASRHGNRDRQSPAIRFRRRFRSYFRKVSINHSAPACFQG